MEPSRRLDLSIWALPAIASAFHLVTHRGYGYFRDELYYLACGEHLSLGYVDHPPLIGIVAALVRALLGESLFAIRLLPALAAGATVALAAATAREMGGGRFARLLAGSAALLAPIYLALFSIFSMNAFDVILWAAAFWVLARLFRTGNPRLWLGFGLVAGLGLENKISVLFLGLGVFVGLVLSGRWEALRARWLWLGGCVALFLFLPYLIWQVVHGWPTLEFMENARRLKIAAISPLAFLREQALNAGPTALPVWLSGLAFLLVAREGRAYRPLGWTFLTVLVVLIGTRAKPYYLAPAFAVLFAAGARALESWTDRPGRSGWRAAILAVLVAGGLLAAPLAKPLLPVESYVRYAASLGLGSSSDERHEVGRLPQFYADMFGWRELAETVAGVHGSLPREDRETACVFAQNYGQAGAVDLFGPALGLPKAISAHNSYFLWGPGDCAGEVVIIVGDDRDRVEELFESVELGATYRCDDCMPYEDGKPIWIARGLRVPVAELWPSLKSYI